MQVRVARWPLLTSGGRLKSDWRKSAARHLPPLAATAIFLVILIAMLPSALNLPQSNPTETLEYAPVPPDSEAQPSASGNFGSLGLGSSSSLLEDISDIPGPGQAAGTRPSTKRCVGTPPRQTADPLSPPCVAFFEGDNSGATYLGVSREEIRILVYVATNVGQCGHFKGCQNRPVGQYHDLAKAETPDDYYQDVYLRNWQRYFNDRYQTYNRFVHFYAYYHQGLTTPESRRAQAADNYSKVKPFAVLFDSPSPANLSAYQDVAAQRGMIVFASGAGLAASQFTRYPKLSWGFLPSLEQQSRVFSDYLCQKVKPNPVSYAGSISDGTPRKFGLVYSQDPNNQNFRDFKDNVKNQVAQNCGMTFAVEKTYARDNVHSDPPNAPAALEAMRAFQEAGVTTLVWPLGYETNFGKAGQSINYLPEWIIAGDTFNDASWPGADQQKEAWEHAIVVTPSLRQKPNGFTQTCEDAYTEVHPELPKDGFDMTQTCFFYPGLRQLFIGIQAAGPRIGPSSMDKGYRAIPAIASQDPSTPACYYVPGDQTCVKDVEIMHWDSQSDGSQGEISGCWRMVMGGKRFLAGGWPGGNIDSPFTPNDQCNGWVGGFGTRVGT
jgi:hypothetical protein